MARSIPLDYFPASERPTRVAPAKPGLYDRFVRMLIEHQRRRAEREIARFIHNSGDRMTDSLERDIEQYALRHPSLGL